MLHSNIKKLLITDNTIYKVYELSVDCSIKASRYEELTKCLSGLIDTLYTIDKVVRIYNSKLL